MNTIIFDMDGVLLDTEDIAQKSWEKTAYYINVDKEALMQDSRNIIGMDSRGIQEYIQNKYPHVDDKLYESWQIIQRQVFDDIASMGIPVMNGAFKLLDKLKEKGIVLGLASSTRKEKVIRELKCNGLFDYFDDIVGGDMVKKGKPAPDIYLLSAKNLGVNPVDAYVIEDSYSGVRSAFSAGMKPIMIPDKLSPTKEMREKCIAILPSLLDVLQIIE